jgi:predicted Fe-Mo cluster-binding NifX family protein
MKIAFTSTGLEWESNIDPRFGRTDYLLIYDEEKDKLEHFDNRDIENVSHGAGPKTAQKLCELNADVLVTGNGPGGNADRVLEKAGINVYTGAHHMTINEAYKSFKKGELKPFI